MKSFEFFETLVKVIQEFPKNRLTFIWNLAIIQLV